jgi:hypothetical protein
MTVPAGDVTVNLPVAAVGATAATNDVPSAATEEAATGESTPNVTVEPGPKPPPEIVTDVPGRWNIGTVPAVGEMLDTNGAMIASGNVSLLRSALPTLATRVIVAVVAATFPALRTRFVTIEPPCEGAAILPGLNCAVTPAGRPLVTASVIVPVTPLAIGRFNGTVTRPNGASFTCVLLVSTDSPEVPIGSTGAPGAMLKGLSTVSLIDCVSVRLPPDASTFRVACAAIAVAVAVSCRETFCELAGCGIDAGENTAVTPLGSPLTRKLIAVATRVSATVNCVLALAPLCAVILPPPERERSRSCGSRPPLWLRSSIVPSDAWIGCSSPL